MSRYESQLQRNMSLPTSQLDWQKELYFSVILSNTESKKMFDLLTEAGFKDMGSYYTIFRRDRFLYDKDGIRIFFSGNGHAKFNVEFETADIAIKVLLKLKKINDLKYELNDQLSIDFYFDSTSLTEIINSCK